MSLGSSRVSLGSGRVTLGSIRMSLGLSRVSLGSSKLSLGSLLTIGLFFLFANFQNFGPLLGLWGVIFGSLGQERRFHLVCPDVPCCVQPCSTLSIPK